MATVKIAIRSFRDGSVTVSSHPSLEEIAQRLQASSDYAASHAEIYALRMLNHMRDHKKLVAANTREDVVTIQLEDTGSGAVAAVFDPKASEIYQRHRDNVARLSEAESYAMLAIEALRLMSRAAAARRFADMPKRIPS